MPVIRDQHSEGTASTHCAAVAGGVGKEEDTHIEDTEHLTTSSL